MVFFQTSLCWKASHGGKTKFVRLFSQLDWQDISRLISVFFLASCRPVYPYGLAVIHTDSNLKFRCYAGWVFKLE